MSLAAAEVARDFCPTVYVDTESDSFWWVHPTPRKEPLQASFTVEDFFKLHGQPWHPASPPSPAEQIVALALAANFKGLESLLRYLKKRADGDVFTPRSPSSMEMVFLKKCEDATLIEQTTGQGSSLSWNMKKARFFRQNDWLECLAFAACQEAGFDDVQWKIPVSGTETDLDVAATRGPLMLICSCKSGKFNNSHLDELDAQARLVGGLFCKKAVVLTEAIAFRRRRDRHAVKQARAALESRAKTLRIQPFYWTDYADLGRKMKALLSTGRR